MVKLFFLRSFGIRAQVAATGENSEQSHAADEWEKSFHLGMKRSRHATATGGNASLAPPRG